MGDRLLRGSGLTQPNQWHVTPELNVAVGRVTNVSSRVVVIVMLNFTEVEFAQSANQPNNVTTNL